MSSGLPRASVGMRPGTRVDPAERRDNRCVVPDSRDYRCVFQIQSALPAKFLLASESGTKILDRMPAVTRGVRSRNPVRLASCAPYRLSTINVPSAASRTVTGNATDKPLSHASLLSRFNVPVSLRSPVASSVMTKPGSDRGLQLACRQAWSLLRRKPGLLMPQFTVYKNKNPSSKALYPLLVGAQADLLDELHTRLVIPLSKAPTLTKRPMARLTPLIYFDDEKYLLITPQLAGIARSDLGAAVGSIADQRDAIASALALLITGA